jgi:thiol-disulfide isomerase/thioredoxin
MSTDINPTTSPTLTDLLQGGENKTEQQGYDLAEFRLKTFNQMLQHATAYQIVRKQEGSISEEECTSIIQGYNHIQTELTQADNSFCCEECGQGSPYLFSNDDGLCSWCVACRSDEATLEQLNDEDDDEQLHLDDYAIKLKHFGESYQPTSEEVMEVIREENPTACCDWHSQAEATKEQPCAMWQGGSNFAPNFGEEVQGEGEYDFENALFLSHVEHLIEGKHLLEILQGWVEIDCPSCSNKIDFERDGDGCRADCFHCEVGSSLNVVMS